MSKDGVMVHGWLCVTMLGGERIDLDDPADRARLAAVLERNAASVVLPPIRVQAKEAAQ